MTKQQLLNVFGEHAHRSLAGTQMLNEKEFFAALSDIKNTEMSELPTDGIADMIETYFKLWNGKGFDIPTPIERQGFEACAEAITNLLKGER